MHLTPHPARERLDGPLLGRVVAGRYRVHSLVARGSMGRIYRARDLLLHRDVALKWMSRRSGARGGHDIVARFRREGQVLASLHSPFIVKVHDQGEHEGSPYLVMELVPGLPLSHVLRDGPLPPRRAVRITRQLLRALSVVHTEGFVHRDLKPSNLMVHRAGPDDTEQVVLLDFGLVKHTVDRPDEELTLRGTLLGTPLFIAPEILYGASPTHQADLFSVGVLLFQMLTGQVPFRGDQPATVLQAIMQDDPRPLRQYRPGLRPMTSLQWIVDHCLAKDPTNRFLSVAALDRALALISAHLDEGVPIPAMALHQGRLVTGDRPRRGLRMPTRWPRRR